MMSLRFRKTPRELSRTYLSPLDLPVSFQSFHPFFLVTDLLCFTPPLGTCSRSSDILEDIMDGQLFRLEQF